MNWYRFIKISALTKTAINVNTGTPYEATLVSGPETAGYFTEFYIQEADNYGVINIRALASNQGGLVYSVGYIVIDYQSSSPIVDQLLKSIDLSNFAQAKWDEGRNPMLDMLGKANNTQYTNDPNEVNMTEIPETEVRPLPSGITVHQSPIYAVLGPYPGETQYRIKAIVAMLDKAAQPMIANNLIDFYGIHSSLVGNKIVRSQRGQQDFDNFTQSKDDEIGYYKYIVGIVLKNYPNLLKTHKQILDRFIKSDPNKAFKKVDLTKTSILGPEIERIGSGLTWEIFNAVVAYDDKRLAELEKWITVGEQLGIDPYAGTGESLRYWLQRKEFESMIEHLTNGEFIYFDNKFLDEKVIQWMQMTGHEKEANLMYDKAREAVIQIVQKGDVYQAMNHAVPLADKLELPPQILQAIDQLKQKMEEDKATEAKRREEAQRQQGMTLNWEQAWYDLKTNKGFTALPYNYSFAELISSDPENFLGDQYEHAYYTAIEKAEEEAYLNREIPASQKYQESGDIDDDISYDAEDFLVDMGFWEDDSHQPLADQFNANPALEAEYVKTNLRDQYVKWKIQKLQEKEGSDEVSSEEVNEYLSDATDEIYPDVAYQNGIMFVECDDKGKWVVAQIHSKYQKQAIEVMNEFIRVNIPTSREYQIEGSEKPLTPRTSVSIDFVDVNQSIQIYPKRS